MADIISGSSRFNGDKNAPARKVIQMNNVSEAATHETEDDEIVKHRIKKHRRHMVIIAAIGVIVIAIAVVLVMRLIDGYVFTSYSVTGSLNREDIEYSGYIAYGDGYIRYSNDGAAYYTAKGKALWNQTYSMQKPQVKICEDCVAIGDINGNTIYIFNLLNPSFIILNFTLSCFTKMYIYFYIIFTLFSFSMKQYCLLL